jgi:uncharacterized protein
MLRTQVLDSITGVAPAAWNALDLAGRPFLRHEFLAAAELSGSAVPATGWTPTHLLVSDAQGVAGALPLYLKTHSWGEFVFDFAWARAYERHGLDYYPKLVSAVPFTPANGPRFLIRPGANAATIRSALLGSARELLAARGLSSLHVLLASDPDRDWLEAEGLVARLDCQFHWHNAGFASFDDFLGTFTAEKRKKVRRERRRVAEAGIRFIELTGADLDPARLGIIYALHARTFAVRGNPPYLTPGFFERLAATLPQALMVKLAVDTHGDPVACAIFLRGGDTLYGRYWGATGDYHSLHFEACYYQGIDYCIREGLARFEPGTQGEHKIARGFSPSPVWSLHEIVEPAFRSAIREYLGRERAAVAAYMQAAGEHVPFRRDAPEANLDIDVRHTLAQAD